MTAAFEGGNFRRALYTRPSLQRALVRSGDEADALHVSPYLDSAAAAELLSIKQSCVIIFTLRCVRGPNWKAVVIEKVETICCHASGALKGRDISGFEQECQDQMICPTPVRSASYFPAQNSSFSN